ncbi:aromatic acid exporter family protein [Atopobacter phocae]|uniref:aromatic acid exporter family protein n=1 Tax=Atopobacter phocae TaxID=136492 RepID=UPI000472DE77|nr:aromatic acid exporter family protein [Atopobacter phocae]
MRIEERTVKIVLAVIVSVALANVFQLNNPMAAGVIAILSILDTWWESIRIALARIASTLLAFLIASICFYFLGYELWTFALYLLIYVPIAFSLNWQAGIAPCTVLVTHFYAAESIALPLQINGLLLMLIGAGSALIFNIYKPNKSKEMQQLTLEIEATMRTILKQMADFLTDDIDESTTPLVNIPKLPPDATIKKNLAELAEQIERLNTTALTDYRNQMTKSDDYYIAYAQMRREQYDHLKEMREMLNHVRYQTDSNGLIAKILLETSDQLHETNPGINLLLHITDLYKEFKNRPLPQTREEFESRAVLYQILQWFERFISIKRDFYCTLRVRDRFNVHLKEFDTQEK